MSLEVISVEASGVWRGKDASNAAENSIGEMCVFVAYFAPSESILAKAAKVCLVAFSPRVNFRRLPKNPGTGDRQKTPSASNVLMGR